jgi:hypothetical protein
VRCTVAQRFLHATLTSTPQASYRQC